MPSSWIKQSESKSDSDELFNLDEEIRKSEVNSQWTRVKSLRVMKQLAVQAYDLDKDIRADLSVVKARQHIAGNKGVCIFDPKEHDGRHQNY